MHLALETIAQADQYPSHTNAEGRWVVVSPAHWVSGFFPGCLWFVAEETGDSEWMEAARRHTDPIAPTSASNTTHDLGFMHYCSFGAGLEHVSGNFYRDTLLRAADSVAQRYDPDVGCIRSWGSVDDLNDFQVIIDNMMNLELLFWAAKNAPDARYYHIAVEHARRTAHEHICPDGSTYHVVHFDPVTGLVTGRRSAQGEALNSCWSRGQAWAIYGYAMTYRETTDTEMLESARRVTDYFLAHLPDDQVPYWDFDASDIPRTKRDTSAGAIAAAGLLILHELEPDPVRRDIYFVKAQHIVTSLCETYLTPPGSRQGILDQAVSSRWDSRDPILRSYIFGDYYFLESLRRLEAIRQ